MPADCCAAPGLGRRGFLGTLGALGVAGAGLASTGPAAAATSASGGRQEAGGSGQRWPRPWADWSGLHVVLLGTQAGPPPVLERAGISTAVVVDGRVYVVDAGRGAVTQYQRAGLAFADLGGIFLTHLHADHICDYYNFFLLAGTSTPGGDELPSGVPVRGPGRAGALPPAAGGAPVETIAADNPTPGTVDLTQRSHEAFAYSSNLFRRAAPGQIRDIRELVDASDVQVPTTIGADPLGDTAPPTSPFEVFEDDRVKVSATLVPHGTVFPALAFRIDTDYGSVTLSGDTRVSANLVQLARGSDLLVHEAMNLPVAALPPPFVAYQQSLHTSIDDVGQVAQDADVSRLAISHLIDFAHPEHIDARDWRRRARRGYDGRVTVGRDLQVFGRTRHPSH